MKEDESGNLRYKGVIDCFIKSIKREGFTGLWVGLKIFTYRVGTYVVINNLLLDSISILFKEHGF